MAASGDDRRDRMIMARAALRALPALAATEKTQTVGDAHRLAVWRAGAALWSAAAQPRLEDPAEEAMAALGRARPFPDGAPAFEAIPRHGTHETERELAAALSFAGPHAAWRGWDAVSRGVLAAQDGGLGDVAQHADRAARAYVEKDDIERRVYAHGGEPYVAPPATPPARDAIAADGRAGPARRLAEAPLWPEGAAAWAAEAWSDLRKALRARDGGWMAWIDWYDDRLSGAAVDDAAMAAMLDAPPGDWTGPPETVNAAVAARLRDPQAAAHAAMQARIARLEATLARATARPSAADPAPPPMGHNRPPEPLAPTPETLAADLAALKAQPVRPADAAPARAAVGRLRAALGAMLGWSGAKLDAFLDGVATEGGRSVGKLLAPSLLAGLAEWRLELISGLASVLTAAQAWLAAGGAVP